MEATYSSEYPIRSLEIYVNGKFYRSVDVGDKKSGTVRGDFALARSDGNQQSVQVRIVDKYGYSAAKNYEIELLDRDTTAPTIISDIVSPLRVSAGSFAVLTGTIEDANDIVSIQFFLDGDLYGSVKDQDYYHLTLDTSSELDS